MLAPSTWKQRGVFRENMFTISVSFFFPLFIKNLISSVWLWLVIVMFRNNTCVFFQGDTPKHRAEKAKDAELAAYLENCQHYQMIQREDQETAVWPLTSHSPQLSCAKITVTKKCIATPLAGSLDFNEGWSIPGEGLDEHLTVSEEVPSFYHHSLNDLLDLISLISLHCQNILVCMYVTECISFNVNALMKLIAFSLTMLNVEYE